MSRPLSDARLGSPWRALLIASVLLATACGGGGVTDRTGPDTTSTNPGGGGGGGGTVQRGSISVQVTLDPADAAVATAAGVTVAGLPVTLVTLGSNEAVRTATTDASGTARFTGLLEGAYAAGVTRTLTSAEMARLPEGERDASVFAGGANTTLSPGATASLNFALLAARRGGLVISEVWSYNGPPVAYGLGDYVEIYNNGDTTAYLDGLLLAYSNGVIHTDNIAPCTESAKFRVFGGPFWARIIWRFPGSGREHPVRPGEGQVIAMDAINHRAASGQAQYQDLSGAHFEQFMSDADTDNPNAADMERVLVNGTGAFGRGFPNSLQLSIALLRQTATSTWTSDVMQGTNINSSGTRPAFTMTGLPATAVLDVFSYATDPVFSATFGLSRSCAPWTSAELDRGVAEFHRSSRPEALRRRSLGIGANGREILQDTRNSTRDIEYAAPLLRSLNK